MRLIDADELIEKATREKLDTRELIIKMIDNAPTMDISKAEVEEVPVIDLTGIDFSKDFPCILKFKFPGDKNTISQGYAVSLAVNKYEREERPPVYSPEFSYWNLMEGMYTKAVTMYDMSINFIFTHREYGE